MSLKDFFTLLVNIRFVNIAVLMFAVPHFIITWGEPAGRLPRPIEIVVMLGFLYLMEKVVERGENKFQRFIGYFGSYFLLVLYMATVSCYVFNLDHIVGMPCTQRR
ncbi:MAG: hypothetical protein A2151_09710 [Candidatus Muproteobacteria bacterium RBG_16_65_34]|uniref:Uncharacterized protein n=1 Tax=Candidatus Muproteobacteria bacterium RBG_16_65_34 TaxID=1817760 RepID=A0A1F6TLU9_9PROT|nr:MAG: hypothetical protein A2151_09710 [Candidatus Muproteobacteria bacterium RBG_16_65_34]